MTQKGFYQEWFSSVMQDEFTKERESGSTKRASLMREYLEIQKAIVAATTKRLQRGQA